ncbi:MAG: methionine adenosyltransferase [Candidatus Aenigmarchaeota archaeon]|nr:methionine adenosyltransferase [Candidatus Aenigmarchaeota archaeon]
MSSLLFSSESVGPGHPDKICDQISDAFVDAALEQDPQSRVAVETGVKAGIHDDQRYAPLLDTFGAERARQIQDHGAVVLLGELTTRADINPVELVKGVVRDIGYRQGDGFDPECFVIPLIGKQSPNIAQGVDRGTLDEQGAGDQGLMFGSATNETAVYMPLPIYLARALTNRMVDVREDGTLKWLRPDTKSQVTVEYDGSKPVGVTHVVIAAQHLDSATNEEINEGIMEEVVKKIIPPELLNGRTKYHINGTGRFVVGGPVGDSGVTGRKIIVDTYGGMGRHGGGAFSGKDPSKVDRSAAYAARWIAKNVVAAGLAHRCEVQLAYVIGKPDPLNVTIQTYGTGEVVDDGRIADAVRAVFPLRPGRIIEALELTGIHRPCYRNTAKYGHFGRDGLSWERLDKISELRTKLQLD